MVQLGAGWEGKWVVIEKEKESVGKLKLGLRLHEGQIFFYVSKCQDALYYTLVASPLLNCSEFLKFWISKILFLSLGVIVSVELSVVRSIYIGEKFKSSKTPTIKNGPFMTTNE